MRKAVVAVLLALVVVSGGLVSGFQPSTALGSTPSQSTAQSGNTYVVQSGDYLYAIALRFSTTVGAIVRANNLSNADYIVVGQWLVIPVTSGSTAGSESADLNVVAAGAQAATPDAATVSSPQPASAAVMSARAAALLAGLNEQRIAVGLRPLRFESALLPAAQVRSDDMATRNYFSHTTPEGGSVHDLLSAAGLHYAVVNEILARNNYPDEQTVSVAVKAFMASSAHRAHILYGAYRLAAVAEARTAAGMKYFTVILSSEQ